MIDIDQEIATTLATVATLRGEIATLRAARQATTSLITAKAREIIRVEKACGDLIGRAKAQAREAKRRAALAAAEARKAHIRAEIQRQNAAIDAIIDERPRRAPSAIDMPIGIDPPKPTPKSRFYGGAEPRAGR